MKIVRVVENVNSVVKQGYIGKVVDVDTQHNLIKVRRYYPSSGKMSKKSKGWWISPADTVPYYPLGEILFVSAEGRWVEVINNDDWWKVITKDVFSGRMSVCSVFAGLQTVEEFVQTC